MDDMYAGWHPDAIEKHQRKISRHNKQRRNEYIKSAPIRRAEYRRIAALSTADLIGEIGNLGGGDDYDGCFTRAGCAIFKFAKRCLKLRILRIEQERDAARAEVERLNIALRLIDEARAKALNDLVEASAEVERLSQQIIDAVEQDDSIEDGMIGVKRVREIVQKVSGKLCDDDSLWFTGEEWQAVIGEREDLRAELERLRNEYAKLQHAAACFAWSVIECDENGEVTNNWSSDTNEAWDSLWAMTKTESAKGEG